MYAFMVLSGGCVQFGGRRTFEYVQRADKSDEPGRFIIDDSDQLILWWLYVGGVVDSEVFFFLNISWHTLEQFWSCA